MIKEYYGLSGEKITEQEALEHTEFMIRWSEHLSDVPFKEEEHIINGKRISFGTLSLTVRMKRKFSII